MKPTLGRTLLYILTAQDATFINNIPRSRSGGMGSTTAEGDVLPAVVVRIHDPKAERPLVNLKVLLDGNDDYWATSRTEGDGPGTWSWPPREPEAKEKKDDPKA